VRVTGGSEHLKHTINNQQERNIESATTRPYTTIFNSPPLSRPYGDGRSCWLIDGMKDIKAGDSGSILGCPALGTVEV